MPQDGLMVSIHPFGLSLVSGGAKILRTLYQDAPIRIKIINTSLGWNKEARLAGEIKIERRPYFGRIERTRFASLVSWLDGPCEEKFLQKVRKEIAALSPSVIHAVAHDTSFWPAFQCSRDLQVPFVLSVHDDLEYLLLSATKERELQWLATVWSQADMRFVISREMGEEYSARYGARPYEVVSDGFEQCLPVRPPASSKQLKIYFMGLFHIPYSNNLDCLIDAADDLRRRNAASIEMVFRCGVLPSAVQQRNKVKVLPMVTEGVDLIAECAAADLLYLPLPVDEAHANFVRLSLSTKLVSYIASGTPILFHGPADSAAGTLLANGASMQLHSNDAEAMSELIASLARGEVVLDQQRRTELQQRFNADTLRSLFWTNVLRCKFSG
jgi:hypothetical protein